MFDSITLVMTRAISYLESVNFDSPNRLIDFLGGLANFFLHKKALKAKNDYSKTTLKKAKNVNILLEVPAYTVLIPHYQFNHNS